LSKALYPFAEGGIGKAQGRGDDVDVVASNDLSNSLRATKDAGFLGLLEHGL
jgi:hypothetical protein